MTTQVEIRGLEELQGKLQKIGDLKPIRAGLMAGGKHLKGKIAKYPPRRHGAKMEFKSAKHRAGFFWRLKEGLIQVPYVRGGLGSETLGRRWTVRPFQQGLEVRVGNNASYARLVQGPDDQTKMHKATGWKTTDTVVEEEDKKVNAIIKKMVDRVLEQG